MLKRVGLSLLGGVLLLGQGVYAQSEARPIAQIAQAEEGAIVIEGELTTNSAQADGKYFNAHTITGRANEQIVIDLVAEEFDPLLIVLDADGQDIAGDNDGGEGLNARLTLEFPADGEYLLAVVAVEPGTTGQYRITTQAATAGDVALARANQLNQQGIQLYRAGRYAEAEPLYQRALAIREQELGANHPSTALSLNNLAGLYWEMGRYAEAEPLLQRSLSIIEQELGANHPSTATSLNNLTQLYSEMGRYAEAEPLFQRALAIHEQELGANHPSTATSLNNLALLYDSMGRYAAVEPLYQRALAIREQELGANHPYTATSLNNLAGLYWATGQSNQAIQHFAQGLSIEETNLEELLVMGSERQKQDYFQTITKTTDWVISLNLQTAPTNPEAGHLALQTILRRKGRILDAVSNNIQLLRDNLTPENQRLLDRFNAKRTELAAAVFNPPPTLTDDYRQQVASLRTEAETLEQQLARASAEFRVQTEPVTLAAIQAQIPQDAALIEFVQYRPFDPNENQYAEPRYAVYILTADGQPQWADLGDANAINQKVRSLGRAIKSHNPRRRNSQNAFTPPAQELYRAIMEPVLQRLNPDKTHLIISPDSQLNLLPFATLITPDDNYLLEDYLITYLTSGRDLLRYQITPPAQSEPLILADINYDEPGAVRLAQATTGDNRRSGDLIAKFGPLIYTAAEGEQIAQLLPNAQLLTQDQATENRIKQVKGPEILHIATHGFFLPDLEQTAPTSPNQPLGDVNGLNRSAAPVQENPLLRSGLALAGYNLRTSGTEDGVLTALEVAGLNLYGTKLTVLSACSTGLGDIANGEGVYGLRRALVIAGSETQLMSLWDVSDRATQALMVNYYQKIQNGSGRGEALRDVQLEMIADPNYAAPLYWAAFIPSGDWRPMDSN
ncbi:CHAT domain-containing protein [Spirulina major CS-329]|uniref:CHAT domain-containing protein n=1 Tax=Spirulina major TaxID=270636 RepID=UPI00232C980A|nr:CHAT domain-containing tetratricopeptide repeat protein [Spirulina major]MDB9503380.1 CHAT domain-containing protein [Spirulina major CS-329]